MSSQALVSHSPPVQPGKATIAALTGGRIDEARLARLLQHVTIAPGVPETPPLEVRIPFTGEILGHIPHGTERDVAMAVTRARAAQPDWAAKSFAERAGVFLRFHDMLLDRQDEILDLIQLESGKARAHAFEEVADTAVVARYYAHHAEELLHVRHRRGALPGLTATIERHHPVGVVGFMVPWNYPLNLAVTDAIPALMAGNTAVLRPDRQTSFTALWAVDLLLEAGLPPNVLTLVTGEGPELGPALVGAVDFVMFTGSTRTGKIIAQQAAPRLIGYSLELGGKNPMLVLADADLDGAIDGAVRGCFVGAGQVCVSIERIFVHASLFDAFLERFATRAAALRMSATLDYDAEMGSLTSVRQLHTVVRHVNDALEKGATLHAGGRARRDIGPLFFEATILTGVRADMLLHDEETFGPVVAVYPFADEDDAIARANATRYGLNASVFTRDTRHGVRVASRLQAGTVNVNEVYAAAWGSVDAPIGGFKESGVSRRHGREGILKYTEAQTIAVQRLIPVSGPRAFGAARAARFLTMALRLLKRTPGLR
jgi:succinate-semialdehyde dehydrogenase/glutarate-semialdehyde dehydrogenase